MARATTACRECGQRNRVPAQATGTPVCGRCRQPLPWITEADDDSYASVVERSPVPALVDMWASWCLPCRLLSPTLRRLAREMPGRVKLVKVDVSGAPQVVRRFDVQAVPTLLIVRHGAVVATRIGMLPAEELRAWVADAVAG